MMMSATESEERPAYDVLARKTVEILDVVNSARQLLIEKYNNDQSMWLEAIFHILMIKNPVFVEDERNSSIKDFNVHKVLRDQVLEMYRVLDDHSLASDREELLETGCNLIANFRVFTNFLLQTKLDVVDELDNLQFIAINIEKYVQRYNSEQEKKKTAGNEREKLKSVGIESEKVKLVCSEPQKVKQKSSVIQQEKVKPVSNESEEMKPPAPSKRNKNEETFGIEAIELASKDSVVTNEKRPTTPAKVGANERICDVCKDRITLFNNNEEFSVELHEKEAKHKSAVKKKMAATKISDANSIENVFVEATSAGSLSSLVKNKPTFAGSLSSLVKNEPTTAGSLPSLVKNALTAEETAEIRKTIVDQVGSYQADFIKIGFGEKYYCTVCECKIYSMHNVVAHVQGKNHTKNCCTITQKSNTSKNESDSRDVTSDEVDSAEDDGVFRVGSAIPIKSLF